MITLSANIPPIAPEAFRHAQAAGIIHRDIRRGLDVLVKGIKTTGIKFAAVWPMAGGSAWSCKFNIINPIDSDLGYRLNFVNAPVISHMGVAWNGTSQYANTFLSPAANAIIQLNDAHLSCYSRTNAAQTGAEIGMSTAATIVYFVVCIQSTYELNTTGTEAASSADTRGYFFFTRTSSTLTTYWRNAVSVDTAADVSTSVPSGNIYIGARNANGTANLFTNRQCAFASVGAGATTAQVFWWDNIMNQFQLIVFNRSVKNVV